MEELSRNLPESVRLFFGAVVDPLLAGAATVTLLAGAALGVPEQAQKSSIVASSAIPEPPAENVDAWGREVSQEACLNSDPEFLAESPEAEQSGRMEGIEPMPVVEAVESPVPEEFIEAVEEPAPIADAVRSPKPVEIAGRSAALPSRTSPDLRRDIGASFLKRRLLARNAEVTARAEEAQLAQNLSRSVSNRGRELSASDEAESSEVPQQAASPSRPEASASSVISGAEEQSAPGMGQASGHVAKSKSTVQEQMRFEPVSRGRFEKTDPTVVDGQDLDVPTFLRRRISLGNDSSSASSGR
jgi:cell division protein FtsZ